MDSQDLYVLHFSNFKKVYHVIVSFLESLLVGIKNLRLNKVVLFFTNELYIYLTAHWFDENFEFKHQVSSLAKTFVKISSMCLIVGILPWIVFMFFCKTIQESYTSNIIVENLISIQYPVFQSLVLSICFSQSLCIHY